METTFENARVGDRVWSIEHGWGKVIQILSHKDCKLNVLLETGDLVAITEDGKDDPQGHAQIWFWDEVIIEAPPRPKRKVVKKVERWVNVYPRSMSKLHSTEGVADACASGDRVACVKLTGEYEVEE